MILRRHRLLSLTIALLMLVGMNIPAYANVANNDLVEEQIVEMGEQDPAAEDQGEQATLEYSIEYVVKDTEEPVPGLATKLGTGELGEAIEVEYPEVEGYVVVENQPLKFTINEDLDLNKITIYYSQDVIEAEAVNSIIFEFHLEDSDEVYLEKEVMDGEVLSKPSDPKTSENQRFIGWFEEGKNEPFVFGEPIEVMETKTIKVYAIFEEIEAKELRKEIDGITIKVIAEPGIIPEGTTLSVKLVPERERYLFRCYRGKRRHRFTNGASI